MALIKGMKNLARIGVKNTKNVVNQYENGLVNATEHIGKMAQIKKPIIDVKDKEGNIKKSLGNLYTGKKANPLWVGAAGGAYLVGKNLYKSADKQTMQPLKLATMNNYQEIGAPDIMMYDGVGQERAPKNMNADGSIVFGLHNMRRG